MNASEPESEPGFERGLRAARARQAIGDGTRRLADLEAQVPQHIKHIFDDLFVARRELPRVKEQQVDIGMGR